jgi:[ribosomal protein S18]-alanine N-acetyltransferase
VVEVKQDIDYYIRPMQERDIPQVLEIDREAFPTQWPHPTYNSFKQELRNRLARYIVVCRSNEPDQSFGEKTRTTTLWDKLLHPRYLFGSENTPVQSNPPPAKEHVIGMGGFWLMVGEVHITTIAVRETYREQGIGAVLLIAMMDMAIQLNAHMVTLEVRISNTQAQSLYTSYGFCQTGVRKHYYSDNGEDAYIMSTDTLTLQSYREHCQKIKQSHEQRWQQMHYINRIWEDHNE